MDRFKDWQYPEFDENGMTKYGWCCPKHHNLILQKNSDIGYGTFIDAFHEVLIGVDAQLGSHCSIYTHNTITPMEGPIVIGNGAKIGSYSLILPGVVINSNESIPERSTVYINKKGERIIKCQK
jgi:acetyltransferase-like isoleucine patch superfamily enzyme